MRRRDFIAGIASAAAWPLAVRAQQPSAVRLVGSLSLSFSDANPHPAAATRRGLNEIGYVEAQNLAIKYRWCRNDTSHSRSWQANLVRMNRAPLRILGAPFTGVVYV
jgi:putative ABC transport system substrate-binding protein